MCPGFLFETGTPSISPFETSTDRGISPKTSYSSRKTSVISLQSLFLAIFEMIIPKKVYKIDEIIKIKKYLDEKLLIISIKAYLF